jgi:hypothetical protein
MSLPKKRLSNWGQRKNPTHHTAKGNLLDALSRKSKKMKMIFGKALRGIHARL